MHDHEARRQIAELKTQMERLSALAQIKFEPPLREIRDWGGGVSVSLDRYRNNDPILEIVTADAINGVFDAVLNVRDNPTLAWSSLALQGIDFPPIGMPVSAIQVVAGSTEMPVWAIDLANATSLTAGQQFLCTAAGNEPQGWYYVSLQDNNRGHPLDDTDWWIQVLPDSITPTAWDATTAYVVGNLVTDGGDTFLCVADNTNQQPPNSTYWRQVDLESLGGYDSGRLYDLGAYVQEIQPVYAFQSIRPIGADFCAAVTDACSHLTRYLRQTHGVLTLSDVPCPQCGGGSGSGSGSGECACWSPLRCFYVRFPGITTVGGCNCAGAFDFSDTWIALGPVAFQTCVWISYFGVGDGPGGDRIPSFPLGCPGDNSIAAGIIVQTYGSTISLSAYAGNETALYLGTTADDCATPITLTLFNSPLPVYCDNWPLTIVLTPIDCSGGSGSGGGSTVWDDTFTDTNGTLLDDHTPDTSPCITLPCYVSNSPNWVDLGGRLWIQGNSLVPKVWGGGGVFWTIDYEFYAGQAICTGSMLFTPGNSNIGNVYFGLRADGTSGPVANLHRRGDIGPTDWELDFITASTPAPVTLIDGTPYTFTVQYDGATATATINGVQKTFGYTTTSGTTWYLKLVASANDTACITIDDLQVTTP